MNKRTKVILIVLGVLFVVYKGLEIYMEHRLGSLINASPDRAYDIRYNSIDLHALFKGVTLDEVEIVPVAVDSGGTEVRGTVSYANMDGLVWYQLLLGKKLNMDGIRFARPTFVITLPTDTVKKSSGKSLQELFGDIIYRAKLSRFEIEQGSVVVMEPSGEEIRGRLSNFNLVANEIKTDSVIWTHLVPFELGGFEASIDSMSYKINDFTRVRSGKMAYRMEDSKLTLNDLQMKYTMHWKEVSRKLGKQTDLLEIDLKELYFEGLEAKSELYSDLNLNASKISIDSLLFVDHRDKNMPRPPDEIKPMFKGMIDAIPFTVKVDTILLKNSAIHYGELGVGKDDAGLLRFEEVNGRITRLTTLPQEQEIYKTFGALIHARINGVADVSLDLTVPYDREAFHVFVQLGNMDLTRLNETVGPMAGVEVVSGKMDRIRFEMQATEYISHNKLLFDYSDLKINVIKEGEDHEMHSNAFMSAIANTAIRHQNKPGEGKYLTAEYVSQRNRYRSPFNFMWTSLSDGMTHIVPGTFVQKIIGVDKESKKQARKERKRKKKNSR